MKIKYALVALAVALSVSGCTTKIGDGPKARQLNKELEQWKLDMEKPRESRVQITNIPQAGRRIELEKHQWLKAIRVTLAFDRKETITAAAIAQALKGKGINVMPTLPLDGYVYNGYGITNLDGETALRVLFGPMGLDYNIDDDGKYVAVVPSRSRTFYLKFGKKDVKYTSGSMTGNVGGGGTSGSSSGTSTGGQTGGMNGQGGLSTGVTTGLDTGKGEISINYKFWDEIRKEMDEMLTQCVPTYSAPSVSTASISSMPPLPPEMGGVGGMPGVMPSPMQVQAVQQAQASAAPSSSGGQVCSNQKVGTYSINPATGAITVQAPHWVTEPIANYLQTVKNDNNVTLVYEGMLISVTTSKENSEGIDLQGFASFASGKWGMVVSNNALGGVTVSPVIPGGNAPTVTPGSDTVANSFLGFKKMQGNPAQAFLAYLEANGEFTIKQKPRVASTNGMPGEFAQYDTIYVNQVNQNTSSGNSGSAAVGTSNQLLPFKVGSLLRIVPFYDSETGIVRSPITFSQSVKTGDFKSTQYITGADGEISQIPSVIPQIRDSNYAGEVLMKDGDMIILGGQASEQSDSSGSGMPGYNADGNFLSGFMGQKQHKNQVSTYYLALTLKVHDGNK
ncbi:hypothetical protein N0754_18290 [Pseudomonas aeruginosa]|nr:hypothetical protein [Pseudomonas aeruginosa]MCS9764184.1 hypothetical protein [Pseudomonas aeruginosa]MCS9820361.1 hypothetical protein [Pseudomonas aeruginosa]MCT0240942.1 hypothetical protein [Pseudomonas aeruginosa]MCT0528395.1 hypothetical protein [Pseudomonas aeruginosa]